MAFEIPDHFVSSYTANVEMLLSRQGGKLQNAVKVANYSGESAQVVKQFGSVAMVQKTTRAEDNVISELEHKQRWIFPTDYKLHLYVDKEDEMRQLGSPLSPYVEAGRAAVARRIDDTIIDAMFGTAKTGVRGGTSTTFTAGNVVAVNFATTTSLTVEKLREARRLLLANHNDLSAETPHIAVTAKQLDNLLGITAITSADYNSVKALVNGEINTFMGFKFIHTESLGVDSNSYRRIPVWLPSAMQLGFWNNMQAMIDVLPAKSHVTQVSMYLTLGATRTQENKIVEIKCAE